MTTEQERYNGWTNYETWNVALWLDNDEGSHTYWNEAAQEALDSEDDPHGWIAKGTFTREQTARGELSERLKSEMEDAAPDLGASVWADLLGAALSSVNWYEVAEHYLDAKAPRQVAKSEGF